MTIPNKEERLQDKKQSNVDEPKKRYWKTVGELTGRESLEPSEPVEQQVDWIEEVANESRK